MAGQRPREGARQELPLRNAQDEIISPARDAAWNVAYDRKKESHNGSVHLNAEFKKPEPF